MPSGIDEAFRLLPSYGTSRCNSRNNHPPQTTQAPLAYSDHNNFYQLSSNGPEKKLPKYSPPKYPELDFDSEGEIVTENELEFATKPLEETESESESEQDSCEELIRRVLSNRYCCKILRQILNSPTSSRPKGDLSHNNRLPTHSVSPQKVASQRGKGTERGTGTETEVVEGFATNKPASFLESKNFLVYCLGGLILLCVLEIIYRIARS